jgi:HSP20 family protein
MTFGDIVSTKKSEGSDLVPIFNIQHQMNEMFDRFFTGWDVCPSFSTVSSFPFLNVSETDKEVSIKAELPGMEEGDVRIEVTKNQVTIKGESENEDKDKQETYWMREISYGNFSRTLSLPFEIDSSKTKASFSKGILSLTIEKPTVSLSQTKVIPFTNK